MSYFKLFVMIIITLTVAWFTWFMYRDFYQTLIQAQTVLVLKQEVALEDVDLPLFKMTHTVNEYKRSDALTQPVADPFKTSAVETIAEPTPNEVDDSAQEISDKLDELRSSVFQ